MIWEGFYPAQQASQSAENNIVLYNLLKITKGKIIFVNNLNF